MSAAGGMGGSRAQYHLRQVGVFLDLKMVAKPEVTLNAFAGEFDSATGDVKGDDAKDKVRHGLEDGLEESGCVHVIIAPEGIITLRFVIPI